MGRPPRRRGSRDSDRGGGGAGAIDLPLGQGLNQRNAPPGRVALIAGQAVGGAERQADPAFNTAVGLLEYLFPVHVAAGSYGKRGL